MNWQNVAFDWNQARAFLATLEEGSLSAAARALNQTQPTLGRQVSALEEALGLVLFERIGKSLTPTPAALRLAIHTRAMFDAANQMSLSASGHSNAIEGNVRITASDVMSAYILPPALKKLKAIAPLVHIDVVASNAIQDLQLREADIAIRHVRPEEPELIARLLCETTAHFYAKKSYLDQRGRPNLTSELSAHDIIGFGDNARMIELLNPLGFSLAPDNFKLGSENGVVAWEMAKSGMGVIIMSDTVAEPFTDMERVLPEIDSFEFPVWLATHKELHTSGRIRIVFDLLAEFLTKKMASP